MTVACLGGGGVDESNCCAVCLLWSYSGGGSVGERRFELLRDMWSLTIELNFSG